jgi:hypothetical protein
VGIFLARLLAFGLCALGVGALIAPKPSSRGYGLPSTDPDALTFIRAMGARDLVLGLIVGGLAKPGSRAGLNSAVAATALVAAADFALVAPSDTKESRSALLVHGSGVAGLFVLWMILRSGR